MFALWRAAAAFSLILYKIARRLPQPCAEGWYGRGIYDVVTNPDDYAGQRVVIIGGGDSAFDWAAQLAHRAEHVTLVHRSDRFRAHAATIAEVQANAANGGRTDVFTFHELHDVVCADDRLCGVVLRDTKTKATREVQADPDYLLTVADLERWEAQHGRVPAQTHPVISKCPAPKSK